MTITEVIHLKSSSTLNKCQSSDFTSWSTTTWHKTMKVQSWGFAPVQQPQSYRDRSSALPLVGIEPRRRWLVAKPANPLGYWGPWY